MLAGFRKANPLRSTPTGRDFAAGLRCVVCVCFAHGDPKKPSRPQFVAWQLIPPFICSIAPGSLFSACSCGGEGSERGALAIPRASGAGWAGARGGTPRATEPPPQASHHARRSNHKAARIASQTKGATPRRRIQGPAWMHGPPMRGAEPQISSHSVGVANSAVESPRTQTRCWLLRAMRERMPPLVLFADICRARQAEASKVCRGGGAVLSEAERSGSGGLD
jgi:hypothetical protein